MPLIDAHGRKINYLRLSVTDRCNLRCQYCMPAGGVEKCTHANVLRFEELYEIAAAAVSLGIEKIRVTGGEPLVRKGILPFLERLAGLDGLRELVLTTNGTLLPKMAKDLRAAGVRRLNVSLDSLHPVTFSHITRGGRLADVLDGLQAAEQAGLPIKLNVVAMRGINDGEILDFAELTLRKPYAVRFIEYMPAIQEENWQERVVTGAQILETISSRYQLVPAATQVCAGPAQNFLIPGAQGMVGLITPLSGHFCATCNRIRVTSTGRVRSCLFSDQGTDIRPVLARRDPAQLAETLRRLVVSKPGMHQMSVAESEHTPFSMADIGG